MTEGYRAAQRSRWMVADTRADKDHDRVCASEERHLLVTAPPGTGKTFLTIRLARRLVPELASGARVLVLTFSNQARVQLEQEAVRQLTPDLRKRIEVSNYHRFFWRAVLAYRRILGLPLEVDIGSEKRRQAALEAALGKDPVKAIKGRAGLLAALAEHEFEEFRDDRTPDEAILSKALAAIRDEQSMGRLVFDDLGALFWSLLEKFPTVRNAYLARYPVVLADEHQDASALQDAVVRRLGRQRLVIFADPMQLIHGFRGASQARLCGHRKDCGQEESLTTPHRWHGDQEIAGWLLAVRSGLEGGAGATTRPSAVRVVSVDAAKGLSMVKAQTKYAIANAFSAGLRSVAVLARTNSDVAALRNYLSNNGLHPKQIGTADFEEAREDIEQLPLISSPEDIAHHAVSRLQGLLPTLGKSTFDQVRSRIEADQVKLTGAGAKAKLVLEPLTALYEYGPERYFDALLVAVESAVEQGHHAPRIEAIHALRRTSVALMGEDFTLEEALERYSFNVMAASQTAPRTTRGLSVMTAHQAKGKEFDVVVLAGASERFFPGNDDEARRLFYVAITRATRRWVLIAPDSQPSPLIATLGPS